MSITNFRAKPGNTQVWLFWDTVPGATGYVASVTDPLNNTTSQTVITNRVRFNGLTNGWAYNASVHSGATGSSTVAFTPYGPNFAQSDPLPAVKFVSVTASTAQPALPIPTGQTLVLLGNALDGPTNQLIAFNGTKDPTAIFGPLTYDTNYLPPGGDTTKIGQYSGNSLLKAAYEALAAGASNIMLMRIGGQTATGSTVVLGGITGSAAFPGEVYNGVQLTVSSGATGTTLTVVQPGVKGSNFSVTYDASWTFEYICRLFNNDPRNLSLVLTCNDSLSVYSGNNTAFATQTLTLSGGTYGTLLDDFASTSKAGYYAAITGAGGGFEILDGFEADVLHIAGIYADDDIANTATQSFLTDLSAFCFDQSTGGYPCLGVIGVRPLPVPSRAAINTAVTQLVTISNVYDDSPSLKVNPAQFLGPGLMIQQPGIDPFDSGALLSVVSYPDLVFDTAALGLYTENGAAYYAGMVAQSDPTHALTNWVCPNVVPAYTLTRQQTSTLNSGVQTPTSTVPGGAYVTFRTLGNGNFVVTEDVTASLRNSNYADLYIVRTVVLIEALVGSIANLFISQNSSTSVITALDHQLETALDAVADTGALYGTRGTGYDYEILSTPTDQQLGILAVTLWIRPNEEITKINTVITAG